jgi:septal ring factor EnvC (AmiA/AmiB activator)
MRRAITLAIVICVAFLNSQAQKLPAKLDSLAKELSKLNERIVQQNQRLTTLEAEINAFGFKINNQEKKL